MNVEFLVQRIENIEGDPPQPGTGDCVADDQDALFSHFWAGPFCFNSFSK